MKENVQAFVSNIVYPQTLDELASILDRDGCANYHLVLDASKNHTGLIWTAPRWATIGDIVFFMFSKMSLSHIRRLKKELENKPNIANYELLKKQLEYDESVWGKKLFGKIFAIARISENSFMDYENYENCTHWKSRISACVDDVIYLDNPIDIKEFSEFLLISRQGSITGVYGEQYNKLLNLIIKKNNIPERYKDTIAVPIQLTKLNKNNWLEVTYEYHTKFIYEAQFINYYVDYLLREISDRKILYSEVLCSKKTSQGRVDKAIVLDNKIVFFEVKLNIDVEKNLINQLEQYCNVNKIMVNGKEINKKYIDGKMFVIDRNNIYFYDTSIKKVKKLYDLNKLKSETDLKNLGLKLRQVIFNQDDIKK